MLWVAGEMSTLEGQNLIGVGVHMSVFEEYYLPPPSPWSLVLSKLKAIRHFVFMNPGSGELAPRNKGNHLGGESASYTPGGWMSISITIYKYEKSKKVELREPESRIVVVRAWGEGNGEMLVSGTIFKL